MLLDRNRTLRDERYCDGESINTASSVMAEPSTTVNLPTSTLLAFIYNDKTSNATLFIFLSDAAL